MMPRMFSAVFIETGQPPVQRHQCRLADAEGVEPQQNRHHHPGDVTFENTAQPEIERPNKRPGPDHRHQLQPDRPADQDTKIGARAAYRLGRALVRDQRVGRQRQQLIENDEGKQVACQGQADGG